MGMCKRLVVLSFVVASCGSGSAGTVGGTGGKGGATVAAGTGGVAASGGRGTGGNENPGSGGLSAGSGGTGSGGTGGAGGSRGTGSSAGAGTGAVPGTGGGAAGARATGGAGGGGSATGGAAGEGTPRLGAGGPFAFPQNRKSGMCTLASAATASQSVQTAYDDWKAAFVMGTPASDVPRLRVVRTTDNNDTVSEGIGYGMLAAVYMADRQTFDGLWLYAKSHLDSNGLMNWQISSAGAVIGRGSATDADEDIAWALLMASDQWSSPAYLTDAKAQIEAILAHSIAADGMLKPGDGWGTSTTTFPDYFSPAYFRVFAAATNNARWTGDILERNYEILAKVTGTYGLVPDKTTSTYQNMGDYSYDACRTPWRIAMDYCFNGEARAQAYLMKIGAFLDGVGGASVVDGYSLTGMALGSNKNMAFIGPAGVAGMAGFPKLLNDAFDFGAANMGDKQYYPQSLKIITLLMMSGNFLDYSKL